MNLKVLLPTQVLVQESVSKVVAEAENGSFGLLPGHIDFVAALVPGILSFQSEQGRERFLAIAAGILVKKGDMVLVSTRDAFRGEDLNTLRQTVRDEFQALDEREAQARSAIARLETNFVRRFLEMERGNS